MKKLLYILTFIFCLTSCSSVKKAIASETTITLQNNNLSEIQGTYSNKPLNGDAEIFSLWSTLNFKAEKYENWANLEVRLKINSENKIVAELMDRNVILDTKTLKGKIRKDFYNIKKQFKFDFSYVIFWALGDSSVKMGITENKELIVLRESSGVAFLVIAPVFGADSPIIETKYKRDPPKSLGKKISKL